MIAFKEGRIKICKNFERDKQIFKLYKTGKTAAEIVDELNEPFFASGGHNTIGYSEVTKIISRFKKKIPRAKTNLKNGHIRKP